MEKQGPDTQVEKHVIKLDSDSATRTLCMILFEAMASPGSQKDQDLLEKAVETFEQILTKDPNIPQAAREHALENVRTVQRAILEYTNTCDSVLDYMAQDTTVFGCLHIDPRG